MQDLDGYQQLLLVRLAFGDHAGEFLSDLNIGSLGARRRRALQGYGLTKEFQAVPEGGRRKKLMLRLTESGWLWCRDHLASVCARQRQPARRLLLDVASRMSAALAARFAESGEYSLKDWLTGPRTEAPEAPVSPAAIRQACLGLTHGPAPARVRLAQLRNRLSSANRADVDRTLLEMESRGQLTLYRLDNPAEISHEDRAAALTTPAGAERHVLYLGDA